MIDLSVFWPRYHFFHFLFIFKNLLTVGRVLLTKAKEKKKQELLNK